MTVATHVQNVHGTEGGAKVHRRNSEPVCGPCLEAERQANRDRAKARTVAVTRANLDDIRKPTRVYAREEWRTRARCIGLADVLDPPLGDRDRMSETEQTRAVAVCLHCPVRTECLRWVLDLTAHDDPGGIVAALTEREWLGLRAKRRAANQTHATTTENGAPPQ